VSERWGDCTTCWGKGYRVVGFMAAGELVGTPEELKAMIASGAGIQTEEIKEECGACGGTGFSGDAALGYRA
jgi:hypothetical protein